MPETPSEDKKTKPAAADKTAPRPQRRTPNRTRRPAGEKSRARKSAQKPADKAPLDATALKGKTGLRRLINATRYSSDGIRAAFLSEEAFRQELIVSIILITVASFLPLEMTMRLMCIGSLLILLIVELLNSGIEACIDRIGPEIHPKSKFAKDAGSAAVLFALGNAVLVWICALGQAFF